MQIFLLIAALICANIPLLTFQKSWAHKTKASRMLWIIWFKAYYILLAVAYFLEKSSTGKAHVQTWEFYSITFLVYLIFSYPSLMKKLFSTLKR